MHRKDTAAVGTVGHPVDGAITDDPADDTRRANEHRRQAPEKRRLAAGERNQQHGRRHQEQAGEMKQRRRTGNPHQGGQNRCQRDHRRRRQGGDEANGQRRVAGRGKPESDQGQAHPHCRFGERDRCRNAAKSSPLPARRRDANKRRHDKYSKYDFLVRATAGAIYLAEGRRISVATKGVVERRPLPPAGYLTYQIEEADDQRVLRARRACQHAHGEISKLSFSTL